MSRIALSCFSALLTALWCVAAVTVQAQTPPAESPKTEDTGGVNNCVECHNGLAGRYRKPVEEWRTSVHSKAGNSCVTCHGGNPDEGDKDKAKDKKFDFIGRPDKKTITDFCGRGGCHATALEQFKRGPHYQSVLKTSQPSCTTCHGVHGIQRSSIDIITDKACTGCHPVEYSRDILKMIAGIDKSLGGIRRDLDFLKEKHAEVGEVEKRLNDTRHLFHQLVHVFSRDDMKTTRRIIELETRNLENEMTSKVALIRRLDLLYIIMVFFGLIIVLGMTFYTIFMYSRRRT